MKRACLDCARIVHGPGRRCPDCQAADRRDHPGCKTQPQDKLRRLVLARDDYTCTLCRWRLPASELECDHWPTPYAQDGPDHPANARTLCRECHSGVPIAGPSTTGRSSPKKPIQKSSPVPQFVQGECALRDRAAPAVHEKAEAKAPPPG